MTSQNARPRTIIAASAVAVTALTLSVAVLDNGSPAPTASAELASNSAPAPTEPIRVTVQLPGDPAAAPPAGDPAAPAGTSEAEQQAVSGMGVAPPNPVDAGGQASPTTAAPSSPSGTQASTTTAPTTPSTAPADSPASAAPASSTTQAPSTTAAPAEQAPQTEYLYYTFDGVASQIILAVHDGSQLEFWSVTPEPGWAYAVEQSRNEIEIEFRSTSGARYDDDDDDDGEHEEHESDDDHGSSGGEAKFTARLIDGQVHVSRER